MKTLIFLLLFAGSSNAYASCDLVIIHTETGPETVLVCE